MDQPMPGAGEYSREQFPPFMPELEAWLLEAADKPTTPLTKADFDSIRERVRTKISAA